MTTKQPWGDLTPINVSTGYMKFNKLYDGVAGTITDIRLNVAGGKYAYETDNFDLLVDHGFHHDATGNKIVLEPGTPIIVSIKYNEKTSISRKVRKLKIGQKVAFALIDFVDTGKGNPFKNIEVYSTGEMDEEWVKANQPASYEDVKEMFSKK